MTAPLTLPGAIPGLLRRGSPVVHARLGHGLVVDPISTPAQMWTRWLPDACEFEPGPAELVDLALDLTDPTGRAHAAWWLANQPGNESVVSRRRESPRWTCCPGASNDPGDRLWHLTSYGCAPYRDAFEGEHDPRVVVPALAALNPDDPRLLPDGSRWVDAEALRLVCLHVAGVSA